MYPEYLMHYGRLGMKWGQHLFGRDRTGQPRKKRESILQRRRNAVEARRQAELNARKQKILSNPKLLYKHRNEFTKKEVDDALKQIQWERQLKSLATSEVSKGEKFLDSFSRVGSKIAKAINTTKALNKATDGLLFNAVDDVLSSSEVYSEIKKNIEPLLDKKDSKNSK